MADGFSFEDAVGRPSAQGSFSFEDAVPEPAPPPAQTAAAPPTTAKLVDDPGSVATREPPPGGGLLLPSPDATRRVLGAIGQGAKEGFFAGTTFPPGEEQRAMEVYGPIFGPAAIAVGKALPYAGAPLRGALRGVQAGIAQTGEELGAQQAGRDVAALLETPIMADPAMGIPGGPRTEPPPPRARAEPTFGRPPSGPEGPTGLLTGPETPGPRPGAPAEPLRLTFDPATAREAEPPPAAPAPEVSLPITPPSAESTPPPPPDGGGRSTPEPIAAHGGPWTSTGKKNGFGEELYENANGVRAVFDDGIPWTEGTRTEPDKGMVRRNEGARKQQFMTADEWTDQQQAPKSAPPKPAAQTRDPRRAPDEKSATEKPTETKTADQPKPDWTLLGTNENGLEVYANPHGVHSVVENGVREIEKVRLRPTEGGMEMSVPSADAKDPRFRVKVPVPVAQPQEQDEGDKERVPPRAEALADEAPAKSGETVGAGDLWRLPLDQLEAMAGEKSEDDHAKLVRALGSEEDAKEFNRLSRKQNSSNPAVADQAAREFDEKFGKLTPEQERLIYGIGETEAQVDDIRAVLAAHSNRSDDPLDAGYEAAIALRKVPLADIMAVPQGGGTGAAQAAYVRLKNAYEDMQAAGVPRDQIATTIADALVERGGWSPENAAEIVQGVMPQGAAAKPVQPPRKAIAAPAAPTPAPQAKAEPKPAPAPQAEASAPKPKPQAATPEQKPTERPGLTITSLPPEEQKHPSRNPETEYELWYSDHMTPEESLRELGEGWTIARNTPNNRDRWGENLITKQQYDKAEQKALARRPAGWFPTKPVGGADLASAVTAHVAPEHKKGRPNGWIEPGEMLWSKTGRQLSPVPKFSPGGGGQRRVTKKLAEWLVEEAQKEKPPASETRWLSDAIKDMDPGNLSNYDADLLRETLFGDPNGPLEVNRHPSKAQN